MKRLSIEHPSLKRVFRETFQESARQAVHDNPPSKSFNFALMAEIRQIAKAGAGRSRFDWVPRTAWRLAPVACGIVFALTIFLMQYDPALEYDMAALSLTDPIGFHETNLFEF